MSVNIKRVKDVEIQINEFQFLDIGEFFEEREDESLYIKTNEETAIRLDDGAVIGYLKDALVFEVEADITYRRKIAY